MAEIVEFRCSSHKRRAIEAGRQATSAEIVIFPGIRYERGLQEAAAEPTSAPSKKSRRKRDTLELIDA